MRKGFIDDFLDFVMMLFFSGLIYGISRCYELFPAYHSLSFMNISISSFEVEMLCIGLMLVMVIVFFREYTILSLLMVGLSPYIFYQFLALLCDYVVFRYIFIALTIFYILFYLILVMRYDEEFNMLMMLNRYCMVMFCIIYLVSVIYMFLPKTTSVENISQFSLKDYENTFIKFKKDNWKNLSKADRQEALNEFVVIDLMYLLGEEDQDIDVYIQSLDSKTMGGYYSFKDEDIIINDCILSDRDKTISVLLHEAYHRYQHKVIDALEDKMSLKIKMIRDVKQWKNDVYNYVSADDSYDEYYNQSLEKDAREYSNEYSSMYIKFIDGLKEN